MAAAKKSVKTTSFLSEHIELKGKLKVEGGIRIDGHFSGHLEAGATCYLGEHARLEGVFVTESLVSSGIIHGSVHAEDTVKITRPGQLIGDVETVNLILDKEVFFQGKCKLLKPQYQKKPNPLATPNPRKAIPERD